MAEREGGGSLGILPDPRGSSLGSLSLPTRSSENLEKVPRIWEGEGSRRSEIPNASNNDHRMICRTRHHPARRGLRDPHPHTLAIARCELYAPAGPGAAQKKVGLQLLFVHRPSEVGDEFAVPWHSLTGLLYHLDPPLLQPGPTKMGRYGRKCSVKLRPLETLYVEP